MENRGKCGLGGRPVGNDAERYYGADRGSENEMIGRTYRGDDGLMLMLGGRGGTGGRCGHRPFALH